MKLKYYVVFAGHNGYSTNHRVEFLNLVNGSSNERGASISNHLTSTLTEGAFSFIRQLNT